MKIFSNYQVNSKKIISINNINAYDNARFNNITTESKDTFTRSKVSFKGVEKFPFEHMGLRAEYLRNEEIDAFIEHVETIGAEYGDSSDENDVQIIRGDLTEIVNAKQGEAYVIRDLQGKLVATGAVIFMEDPENKVKYGGIFDIFIKPEFQQKGIGRWMTQNLIKKGKENGCDSIILQTNNPIACKLYEKLGFVEYAKTESNQGVCLQKVLK